MSDFLELDVRTTVPTDAGHYVLFCDKDGQILGNIDAQLAEKGLKLIEQALSLIHI